VRQVRSEFGTSTTSSPKTSTEVSEGAGGGRGARESLGEKLSYSRARRVNNGGEEKRISWREFARRGELRVGVTVLPRAGKRERLFQRALRRLFVSRGGEVRDSLADDDDNGFLSCELSLNATRCFLLTRNATRPLDIFAWRTPLQFRSLLHFGL